MFPVADDFAAIARRLKEIQAEVARERTAADSRRQAEDEPQPSARSIYEAMDTCA